MIVNISSNKDTLPPYGIVLRSQDFVEIKLELQGKESPLGISENKICLSNHQIYLHKSTNMYDSKLVTSPYQILDMNIQRLRIKMVESGKTNGFNLENDLEDKDTLEFISQLELLKSFFLHGENDQVLKYFIGRGMGLTPAGDDFLVGMLSVFSLQDAFKESILKLRGFILKNRGIYTNDISEQFLLMATDNQFSTSIIVLLRALTSEDLQDQVINNVLNYGATSGVDILFGIIFAYKLVKESDVNEKNNDCTRRQCFRQWS